MWPFGKIEWKTVKMPLSFLDDPSAAESMTVDFEAVGSPDGLCRYFFATYSYPGGEDSWEDYEKLRKMLREVECASVDVELKFRNGALRDFKMTPAALAAATGCDACRHLELLGWGINEKSAKAVAKTGPTKDLSDLDDDDGGIDWREANGGEEVVEIRKGWAVLLRDAPVYEAKAVAEELEAAHIRCRLELLKEDRAFHLYGNGGMGTRMCVLVAPSDYDAAKKRLTRCLRGSSREG